MVHPDPYNVADATAYSKALEPALWPPMRLEVGSESLTHPDIVIRLEISIIS